ncbi:MAG TPA: 6,7-dimethyl-8-ribityllumazine synthase [Thermodesulfobacteriota bacterium]|nr:6,7-dimethyl-8-ribityllumazine synthase [Thermodesulfobacteriota bacterium]
MTKVYEGVLNAKGLKFAIITSRFNSFITQQLVEGAKDTLIRHGCSENSIELVKVPGAYEISFAVKKILETKKYDAVIAVGAIIRGETPHYDYLSSEVTKRLVDLSIQHDIPVASGIITTENLEQAIERAGSKAGNRGSEAAISAIEMANLVNSLS